MAPEMDPVGWQSRLEELARRHAVPGASLAVLADGEVTALATGVLGGFNWSSQHLGSEGLRWEQGSVEQLIVLVVRRCGRRAVHRWDDASTDSGSGWRSLVGCQAKMPAWRPGCPRPWDHAG